MDGIGFPSRSPRRFVHRRGRSLLLSAAVAATAAGALLVRASSAQPRPSIVLISVDTLRADHLGCYGYAKPTSPFLDSLAESGTLFENAYVPRPATSPSHASLLTGVRPRRHGVLANGMNMKGSVDTLAAALKRAGYGTGASVAVAHIGKSVGFARGFDRFFEPQVTDPNADTRRFAEAVNADAKAVIDAHAAARSGKPLFLFVHYFDCHYPYRAWDPSEKKGDPWSPAEQGDHPRLIARYDDGVRRVDEKIRELRDYVAAKLGPNVVVCVTADHGEQIGEHGLAVGHADIYRETVRVPLIIAGPGVPRTRVETAVSTMDVPLFLAHLGGARLDNVLDGQDLLPVIERSKSWLTQMLTRASKRGFLVTGAPAYTRSIGLIDGSRWYIKNFDYSYRQAWVETPVRPAAVTGKPVDAGGVNEDGALTYAIPGREYRAHGVVIVHTAKSADCAMTASASIEPDLMYWKEPIAFHGSIRMVLPAARLDRVTFTVAPARCAGTTQYSLVRLDDYRPDPAEKALHPDLHGHLATLRAVRAADELYDVDADLEMRDNKIAGAAVKELDARLRSMFEETAMLPVSQRKIDPEELRKLRALGYIH